MPTFTKSFLDQNNDTHKFDAGIGNVDPADTPFHGSEASQATSELGRSNSIEEQIRVLLSEMTKKVEEHVSSKAKGQDMDHTLRRALFSREVLSG